MPYDITSVTKLYRMKTAYQHSEYVRSLLTDKQFTKNIFIVHKYLQVILKYVN